MLNMILARCDSRLEAIRRAIVLKKDKPYLAIIQVGFSMPTYFVEDEPSMIRQNERLIIEYLDGVKQ